MHISTISMVLLEDFTPNTKDNYLREVMKKWLTLKGYFERIKKNF